MNASRLPVEVNPYAPPASPDRLCDDDAAGIGVWRDGELLVLHKDADLPPLCIRTGLPATDRVPLRVVWYRSAWQWRMPLRVPMCPRWAFYSVVGRRVLVLASLVMIGTTLGLVSFHEGVGRRTFEVTLFVGLAVLVAVFVTTLTLLGSVALGEPLQFVRSQGNYLWFRGANRKFLEQLPPWPIL